MSYEGPLAESIRSGIETEIDRIGLADFLAFVAEVCEAKAEHIAANWQDSDLADCWQNAQRELSKLANEVNV